MDEEMVALDSTDLPTLHKLQTLFGWIAAQDTDEDDDPQIRFGPRYGAEFCRRVIERLDS